MKSMQYGCVLLTAILLASIGCANQSHGRISISSDTDSSQLEAIILDDDVDTDVRYAAIQLLKQRGNCKRLINVLPPKGGYGGLSCAVIGALSELGCVDAIPYLEKIHDTDQLVSGQFWTILNHDLESLKKIKETKRAP